MSELPATTDLPVAKDPASAGIPKWNRFHKIMAIFVVGWVSVILEKIVKLDSVLGGLKEGGVGGGFVSPFLLIITLPLAWLGSQIGSWKKWRKHQLWFTVGLPALFLLMGPAAAVHERFHPEGRFERFTGVAFPRGARVQQSIIDDGFGPLYDKSLTYEFICTAEETERLINELKLTKRRDVGTDQPAKLTTHGGWSIDGVWYSSGQRMGAADSIELSADATRTKVRITCSQT